VAGQSIPPRIARREGGYFDFFQLRPSPSENEPQGLVGIETATAGISFPALSKKDTTTIATG
jgi:hypothetical protein